MTRVKCVMLIAGSLLWLARDASAQVLIARDGPADSATVTQPLVISGWAIDTRSTSGPGVDQVLINAYLQPEPPGGGSALYVGYQTTMNVRGEMAAAYGPQFVNSGYSIVMSGFAPGTYRVVVFAHSTIDGQWVASQFLLTVLPSPWLYTESPSPNAQVSQPFTISGFGFDAASTSGTGVDAMVIYAYPNPGSGLPAEYWGTPTLAWTPRPEIAAVYGAQFVDSAWKFDVSGKAPGAYTILLYMHSTVSGTWTLQMFNIWIDLPTVAVTIDRTGTGTGGISGTGLTCPGGAGTQQLPCTATYSTFTTLPITAVPDAGSSFAGWGGVCVGTVGATCNVPLYLSQYVTARFVKDTQTQTQTQTLTYYHTDAIGSIRATSDAGGAVIARHDYSPFGEDTAPLAGDPKRFAGKDLDVETALQNFEARMYRNVWGRFVSIDPVGGTLTNPQGWNGYAYALNNPLKFVDPSGMEACVTWTGINGPEQDCRPDPGAGLPPDTGQPPPTDGCGIPQGRRVTVAPCQEGPKPDPRKPPPGGQTGTPTTGTNTTTTTTTTTTTSSQSSVKNTVLCLGDAGLNGLLNAWWLTGSVKMLAEAVGGSGANINPLQATFGDKGVGLMSYNLTSAGGGAATVGKVATDRMAESERFDRPAELLRRGNLEQRHAGAAGKIIAEQTALRNVGKYFSKATGIFALVGLATDGWNCVTK